MQVLELGAFGVLVAVECKATGLKTGTEQQQVIAGSSSGPVWKCFPYYSHRCVSSEMEAAIFVQHGHTATKGYADCSLGTVLTLEMQKVSSCGYLMFLLSLRSSL